MRSGGNVESASGRFGRQLHGVEKDDKVGANWAERRKGRGEESWQGGR